MSSAKFNVPDLPPPEPESGVWGTMAVLVTIISCLLAMGWAYKFLR